jgi:N-acetylneuraminic acid mutarotase
LVGDTLYVVGGQDRPDATGTVRTAYRIDLAAPNPSWQEIDPLPNHGRMLAVAAAFDGALWIVGGVDLVAGAEGRPQRRYLNDALRYDPGRGWRHVADLPHALAAAPSPAPADPSGFFILGGDDGSQTAVAPDRHPGFDRTILRYDVATDRWVNAGELRAARVTTPCVRWNGSWVVPGGEARPGVRSPEVWRFTPQTKG